MYSNITGINLDVPMSTHANILHASAVDLMGQVDLTDHETFQHAIAAAHLFNHAATMAIRALVKAEKELENRKKNYDLLRVEKLVDDSNG